MTEPRITATYWIETAFPLAQAAETMAGEQSTGDGSSLRLLAGRAGCHSEPGARAAGR